MPEDKYLETLNRHIKALRGSLRVTEQAIDECNDVIATLQNSLDAHEKELASLLKERAEYLCPFKIGDYVKGWDYFDKERAAKVIRIYDIIKEPYWNIMIEKDGAPYTLYFADPNELRSAYVDSK